MVIGGKYWLWVGYILKKNFKHSYCFYNTNYRRQGLRKSSWLGGIQRYSKKVLKETQLNKRLRNTGLMRLQIKFFPV